MRQVFYEPTALARCREGSAIFVRLCSALEEFDVGVDADDSALNAPPSWPILAHEGDWPAAGNSATNPLDSLPTRSKSGLTHSETSRDRGNASADGSSDVGWLTSVAPGLDQARGIRCRCVVRLC